MYDNHKDAIQYNLIPVLVIFYISYFCSLRRNRMANPPNSTLYNMYTNILYINACHYYLNATYYVRRANNAVHTHTRPALKFAKFPHFPNFHSAPKQPMIYSTRRSPGKKIIKGNFGCILQRAQKKKRKLARIMA